ncbi:hypothetical protein BU23DRAFT_72078 [Bimuria novae-zelandiae CBS 107.79]|uniref:Uncharacterized protein n=1 Tax=Bimuria novae-zelandiae CBS 107.79 TaxID=1447943 RepID=A0A6A5UK80_9PLEO|nr:hypothetical protein BU23DRAFT_72078 [Bimuria novae-zelandiae CBS 107.79]
MNNVLSPRLFMRIANIQEKDDVDLTVAYYCTNFEGFNTLRKARQVEGMGDTAADLPKDVNIEITKDAASYENIGKETLLFIYSHENPWRHFLGNILKEQIQARIQPAVTACVPLEDNAAPDTSTNVSGRDEQSDLLEAMLLGYEKRQWVKGSSASD